jgi:hypothetical protein
MASDTLPVNPFTGDTITVSVAVEPTTTLIRESEDEMVKLPGLPPPLFVTLTVITALAVKVPDVPVTVTVELPTVAVALAITVRTPPITFAVTPVPVAVAV